LINGPGFIKAQDPAFIQNMDRGPRFLIAKFPGISALGFYQVIIMQILMAENDRSW
jgi:hypothetical protein